MLFVEKKYGVSAKNIALDILKVKPLYKKKEMHQKRGKKRTTITLLMTSPHHYTCGYYPT